MSHLLSTQKTNNSDEWYTPEAAVSLIMPFIPKDKVVWCPFDLEESNFVKLFRASGYVVVNSHISTGQDFFDFQPERFDIIISNPPFSKSVEILERCYELGKPFALIMNSAPLFDGQKRLEVLKKHKDFQLYIPKSRVKFISQTGQNAASPAFKSVYFCHGILPERFVFE